MTSCWQRAKCVCIYIYFSYCVLNDHFHCNRLLSWSCSMNHEDYRALHWCLSLSSTVWWHHSPWKVKDHQQDLVYNKLIKLKNATLFYVFLEWNCEKSLCCNHQRADILHGLCCENASVWWGIVYFWSTQVALDCNSYNNTPPFVWKSKGQGPIVLWF